MGLVKHIINMLKYSCSALVSIILIYPLIGIIAYILKLFHLKFHWEIWGMFNYPLTTPPMLLPVCFGLFIIDIVPLVIIVLAGVYGWITTSIDSH